MKTRILNFISLVCCVAVMVGCSNDDNLPSPKRAEGHIVFNFSTTSSATRATIEGNSLESAVNHLDIFIFENDGSTVPPKMHYERVATASGRAVLNKARSSFDTDKRYWVYVLANSSISSSELDGVATLADLKQLQQQDELIHLTGLDVAGAPQSFLMDGVAYKGSVEPTEPASLQLNDGNLSANTELAVVLRRAAAKIVVNIKRGANVEFLSDTDYLAGYYIHNLPCSSPLLAGVAPAPELRYSDKTNNLYFNWSEDLITVTAYAYSHDFTTGSIMENRTTMVVDIPMMYNGVEYPKNYYQIPVSRNHKLERNMYYAVTVVVNAPGAEDVSQPLEVEPMIYDTADWTEVNVSVGGEADMPKYLNVNRKEMEMRYISTDNTTLYFASSSEVTVSVEEAYYYNKMGVRMDVDRNTLNQISGSVVEGELNGNITITSPLPTNKTIRYIKFVVTNEDGSTPRTVLVAQYPLEYITNVQSWYSYRDDFKDDDTDVTTYENPGSRETGVSLEVESSGGGWNPTYTWTGNFIYHKGTANSGFWRSKVVINLNEDGSSEIGYYYWDGNTVRTSVATASNNARLYHIRITSTSNEYKLGNPKLTNDGFTDPSDENALLVSPSFMIASGLGYVDSNTGNMNNMNKDSDEFRSIVRDHCSKYVEVYQDPETKEKVVLDDWRLPTETELRIIMNYQGTQGSNADAIDYLLNASYYWAASGRVSNSKAQGNNGITAFRCIRDAIAK
ncbi:MAG: hypothetical protein J6U93_01595 [Alistipes sp.]|nr:hypothetical protein [Alistipes sp.]